MTKTSPPSLALESVSATRGATPVLHNLDWSIKKGEIVALLGPSGSGKSTTVRLLLGLLAPSHGRVLVGGKLASSEQGIHMPPEERRIAVVFQDLGLWPHMTAAENLEFVLGSGGVPSAQRPSRAREMLERVGLLNKATRRPGELSGGEQQRVAIARALVASPTALLLDEPLSNLDVVLKHELIELFRELLSERPVATLFVTHDLRDAARLAKRISVLEEGRMVQDGPLEALRVSPATAFVKRMSEQAF